MIVLKYIGCALSLLKNCAGVGGKGRAFLGGQGFFVGLKKSLAEG